MIDYVNTFLSSNKLQKCKTPFYLYFDELLKNNIKAFTPIKEEGVEIFYAMKSNNYLPLLEEVHNQGLGFDVASREEIQALRDIGVRPEKITFSALSKRPDDIKFASKVGIKYYAFDSEIEIEKIKQYVKNPILFARIAAKNKEAAFNLSDKFGMNEQYFNCVLRKAKSREWPIKGITFHVGSQSTSSNAWRDELIKINKLITYATENGINIEYVNIGGGIPARYQKMIPDLDFFINRILQFIRGLKRKHPHLRFFIEPGRSISANTVALFSEVIDIKPYKKPPLVVVDTGVFNGMIEPIEHFEYPVMTSVDDYNHDSKYYRIAGFSCEGYDILNKKVKLPKNIQVGDKVIFLLAGAYTFVYDKFHMVPYPSILEFANMR